MKVNGIVAEYNPFHKGHLFHLQTAKASTETDYTIVVMSGNFMQRGTPALLDKFIRAEMALRNGADLVLELPVCYAVSSAEFFAKGATAIFDKLGVVDHLCFGTECGDLKLLQHIAEILLEEPPHYAEALRKNLREGCSYPVARTWALLQYDPSLSDYKDILATPNNILGIEYIKALLARRSTITPFTTKRVGADYHDKRLGKHQCSAIAIRQAILSGQASSSLSCQMPDSAYALMSSYLEAFQPVQADDLSAALQYKLLTEYEKGYDRYLDVSSDLSDRIRNKLCSFTTFSSFCDLLKSKDMTYTRISRCLLHILLDIKKQDFETSCASDYVPYARILGFRRDATPLLSAIKEQTSIPIVTSLADSTKQLTGDALCMLEQDIRCNRIYLGTVALKNKMEMQNEFRTPIVIV